MNNEKISGFKRNHAGGDEKLVVNKINVGLMSATCLQRNARNSACVHAMIAHYMPNCS